MRKSHWTDSTIACMVMVITPIMTVIHDMRGMDNLTVHAENPKPEHTAGRQILASPLYTPFRRRNQATMEVPS